MELWSICDQSAVSVSSNSPRSGLLQHGMLDCRRPSIHLLLFAITTISGIHLSWRSRPRLFRNFQVPRLASLILRNFERTARLHCPRNYTGTSQLSPGHQARCWRIAMSLLRSGLSIRSSGLPVTRIGSDVFANQTTPVGSPRVSFCASGGMPPI